MDVSALSALGPDRVREALPLYLGGFIADPAAAARSAAAVTTVTATWTDDDVAAILAYLATLGSEHRVYEADPRCRQVGRVWTPSIVTDPILSGIEHLAEALDRGPTLVLGNHLSYLDTIAQDHVLAVHGHTAIADRIVTVAGPKVYADLFRRLAAATLDTLPAPQSTSFEHTAQIPARELARRALESVEAAHGAMARGKAVQIYPEGSRSRTGHLGSFLRGVHRYLDLEGVRIVPGAVIGSDAVFPVGDVQRLHPGPVKIAFGPSFAVSEAGGPKTALSAAFDAVAALLPPAHAPTAETPRIR